VLHRAPHPPHVPRRHVQNLGAAWIHVISPLIAFNITCCFVITLASRATRRSIVSIEPP
jgi:hypothetical protein